MVEQQPYNTVPIDLENQFLVRLPEEPAAALKEAIRSGASNLKERLYIKLEPDKPNNPHLRRGQVKFDGWSMSAKLVDLPTIIESHKTIDRKTLYKTADICQMLICKEGDPSDDDTLDEDERKKDPNKVERKFIHPHGLCPPMKNCRKRRFRKTLKKKHVLEEPEIEKEVKRLFRADNEAVDVKWQLLTEEELNAGKGVSAEGKMDTNVGEQDLFGALSDSDEETDGHNTSGYKMEPASEGDSTMYGDLDSSKNLPGSTSATAVAATTGSSSATAPSAATGPTEFTKDMFKPPPAAAASSDQPMSAEMKKEEPPEPKGNDAVAVKMAKVNSEIAELKKRKQEIQNNIASCPNPALQQRFKETLQKVEDELRHREMEADAFSMFS